MPLNYFDICLVILWCWCSVCGRQRCSSGISFFHFQLSNLETTRTKLHSTNGPGCMQPQNLSNAFWLSTGNHARLNALISSSKLTALTIWFVIISPLERNLFGVIYLILLLVSIFLAKPDSIGFVLLLYSEVETKPTSFDHNRQLFYCSWFPILHSLLLGKWTHQCGYGLAFHRLDLQEQTCLGTFLFS